MAADIEYGTFNSCESIPHAEAERSIHKFVFGSYPVRLDSRGRDLVFSQAESVLAKKEQGGKK